MNLLSSSKMPTALGVHQASERIRFSKALAENITFTVSNIILSKHLQVSAITISTPTGSLYNQPPSLADFLVFSSYLLLSGVCNSFLGMQCSLGNLKSAVFSVKWLTGFMNSKKKKAVNIFREVKLSIFLTGFNVNNAMWDMQNNTSKLLFTFWKKKDFRDLQRRELINSSVCSFKLFIQCHV